MSELDARGVQILARLERQVTGVLEPVLRAPPRGAAGRDRGSATAARRARAAARRPRPGARRVSENQQRDPLGVWFISTSLANLGGGPVASRIEAIERGEIVSRGIWADRLMPRPLYAQNCSAAARPSSMTRTAADPLLPPSGSRQRFLAMPLRGLSAPDKGVEPPLELSHPLPQIGHLFRRRHVPNPGQ